MTRTALALLLFCGTLDADRGDDIADDTRGAGRVALWQPRPPNQDSVDGARRSSARRWDDPIPDADARPGLIE